MLVPIGVVLVSFAYWQLFMNGRYSAAASGFCFLFGFITFVLGLWKLGSWATGLGYAAAYLSIVLVAPVFGFCTMLLLSMLLFWSSALFESITEIAWGVSVAAAVYCTFLICSWIGVEYSNWMFFFPGVALLINDVGRIKRAEAGFGPSQISAHALDHEELTAAVVHEVQTEKITTVIGIIGLISGCVAVSVFSDGH